MAHNPQAPQGPEGHDPAGSTQMFRAFVDEGGPQHGARGAAAPAPAGPRVGLMVGIVAAVAILGTVVWLALG
ncbi:hypothetical protein HHX38_27135 [Streptomyces sp. PKU-MA01144]|uniref:hypothetical protein n=1 Tax=Streptomyces TaxID=1883 RepID=UPI00147DCC07|nr:MULTISPECIES: hypothetical protein [Streptomyces]MCY0984537.1 hypothetical protein [Streptomyces tirandamycinicus]NNJ07771.1 hypothetical protein [Streptomyces sp. PKU-MA01144]